MAQLKSYCIVLMLSVLAVCTPVHAQDAVAAASQASAAAGSAEKAASAAQTAASAAARAALAAASSATAIASREWKEPSSLMGYGLPIFVLLGALIAIFSIKRALSSTKGFLLSNALSEEVVLPLLLDKDGAIVPWGDPSAKTVMKDANGKEVTANQMVSSISRVIAYMGMMAILVVYLGFAVVVTYGFATTGKAPEAIGEVNKFLAAGMTLFAPYVVNKFAAIFQGLTGTK